MKDNKPNDSTSVAVEVLKDLSLRQRELLRLAIIGRSVEQIADSLDLTPRNVREFLSQPVIKAKLALLDSERTQSAVDVAASLQKLAGSSIKTVEKVLDSPDSVNANIELQVKTALAVLDRAGFAPVQRSLGIVRVIHDEDLAEIKKRAAVFAEALVVNEE